jgi:hypothetical protein
MWVTRVQFENSIEALARRHAAGRRVFEHCEAGPATWGGETVTRSMRRVANATL